MRRALKIVALIILCMRVSTAQTPVPTSENKARTATCQPTLVILPGGTIATKSCDGAVNALHPPSLATPPCVSQATIAAGVESPNVLREQENYVIWSFQQSRKIYEWQHKSSIAIFSLVILLVLAGVYFATLQFHYAMATKVGSGAKRPETTEIDASLKGFKVKSSVLGVIVLAISMAFLYLYLVHVYPIVESTATPKESWQATKSK